MHGITFLQDLAVVMIVAGLVTILFHRLKQPVVLGYILAGVIIGPHTPPFPLIRDEETIKTLSELGLVFLMFSLGLEFSLRKLKRVGVTAFIAATLEILLMLAIGYQIGRWFGWSSMDSIFLGAILSISSTTIIVKALAELGKTREKFSELIFGILIVEDILAIALIALLSGIAMTGSLQFGQVAGTLGRLSIFLVVTLVLGLLLVPRLIGYVARFKSNEMLLITVLGLCFGVSLLAVQLHYSVALGAFLIGAVIAESREIGKIEHLTEPLRDMFSAIFFVSIGMLIEPKLLFHYALPIAVITVAVVIGKVFSCSLGTFVAGNDTRTSLRVGMGLAQIGEFSFIIAALGLSLKVTSDFLYPIAVTVSAITTLLTPYLIKSSDQIVNWFTRVAPYSVSNSLEVYTLWLSRKSEGAPKNAATQFIRRWTLQMALNVMLVAGIFIAAVFLSNRQPAWLTKLPKGEVGLNAALWFGAMLLSLPLLIATYRKLQALGMLLADLRVKGLKDEARAAEIKGIISTTVPLTGAIGLAILLLLLSSTLLPSGKLLFVLLLVIIAITALLWRSFIKVYSKAQVALRETLAENPPEKHPEIQQQLPGLLKEAKLQTLTIPENSPVRGRLIRELELRTKTGASIVGIQRSGANVINPSPDEELQTGDHVLLIGSDTQLEKARVALTQNG
ncbi:MAG: cation/H(+) antiporter [Verrucomicrobiales bacterium]|nr:cation/H(+) antiporter [Verrucomicrobiales bacterium]